MSNPCFIYPTEDRAFTAEEVRDMWHGGHEFRVYAYQINASVNSSLKLRIAGFTHVKIVFKLEDGRVIAHEEELK